MTVVSRFSESEVVRMHILPKSYRKEVNLLFTAFEVVQIILGFSAVAISLVGLCYKIFKDENKK